MMRIWKIANEWFIRYEPHFLLRILKLRSALSDFTAFTSFAIHGASGR
jgi:hypothetical protein